MKVVLFCGGQGTRLRDYSDQIPKPLVPVGNLPILWHMMTYYAAHGHKDFILCLGYKGEAIKRFFLEYNAAMSNDFVLENGGTTLDLHEPDIRDWRITFVDTGQATNIGGRLLRVRKHLENEEMFLANYADILTDLDLGDMVEKFRASDAIGGFCAVTPPYSFHLVKLREGEGGKVERMMSLQESATLMNGGYIILRPQIFDNLFEGEELVVEGFARLVEQNRLYAHRHDGFWMPMDTFKEKQALDDMVARGDTPWQVGKARGAYAQPKVA
jgi:glucose-1-phosphate cytidylyltransferase